MTKSVTAKLRMTPAFLAETQRAAKAADVSWSEWMTGAAADRLSGSGTRGWEKRVIKAIEKLDLAPAKRGHR